MPQRRYDETGWQLCSTLEKIHEVIEELRTEVNMYFTTDKILEVSGEMSEALFEEKKRTSIIKSNGIRSTEQSRNSKIEQIKLLINQTQTADKELELGVELPE